MSISVIEPLTRLVLDDERVVGVGDDVDERVADADDVVLESPRHVGCRLLGGTSRRGRYRSPSAVTLDNSTRTACPAPSSRSRYDLVLEPDLDAATFAGTRRRSTSTSTDAVDQIVLNADELDISSVARRRRRRRRSSSTRRPSG